MLIYVIGVSCISAALGGCLAIAGGIVRLVFSIFFVCIALVAFCVFADLSAFSTLVICGAAVVFMNLGWLGVVIIAHLPKLFVLLREQFFIAHK